MANKETPVISSIENLKNEKVTMSPHKYEKPVQCAVLTKSPLKPTKDGKGKMFSMRLCDKEPSSSARVICFTEEKFEEFEPLKTYVIQQFKLKKGFGREDMEMVITEKTSVEESTTPFKIDRTSFTIGQIIRGETENIRLLELTAKVLVIEDMQTVGKYPNNIEKRDILIADKAGQISLVLWRDRAKICEFKIGDVLKIENAVVSTFNKRRYVTTAFETSVEIIKEHLEVDETVSQHTRAKPHAISTIETTIQAIKEYRSLVKCLNCRTEIVYIRQDNKLTSNQAIIRCQSCSTVFLAKSEMIDNECKFLVGEQWFLAKTGPLQHILHRNQPMINGPSADETLLVLNSKFLLRLNLDAKKIEHAEHVQQVTDEDQSLAMINENLIEL